MPKQRDNILDDEDDQLDGESGAEGSSADPVTTGAEGESQEIDASVDAEGDDEDREAKRARRREERARRKEFERERRERDRKLLASKDIQIRELSQRLERLETRSNGHDIARIDQAIDDAKSTLLAINAQKKEAVEKGDGTKVVELDEAAYHARRRYEALSNMREKATRPRRDEPPQLDPRLVSNARGWMQSNRWYDPEGGDEDSLIILALDEALTREGFDATSKEYWEELEVRARKRLPHRYEGRRSARDDDDDEDLPPKERRSPVGGSGARRPTGVDKPLSFKLTPAQVSALKEAGMWDDVALRNKMIKRYREQQRTNGASR